MFALHLLEEGGAEAGISWLVWVVIVVFLLMVVLGWLVASKGWLKEEEETTTHNDHGHEHDHDEHKA